MKIAVSNTMREAAREAARLQQLADRYRSRGARNAALKEHAERLAVKLEKLSALTLCRAFERPTASLHNY